MNNFHDLLRGFDENEESAEDRTSHIRETSYGRRVDFEIVEKTNFSGAFPETIRELITKGPLSCGHTVSRENQFSGYCQGKNLGFFITKKICGNEYCTFCAVQCPCGIFVSANCCARQFEETLYCKSCARKLKTAKFLKMLFLLLLFPFIQQDSIEDEKSQQSIRADNKTSYTE